MLTTFAALVMPILILLMAAVLNVGHVVNAKVMLQNAADRAAYAGAAKQAYVMNRMGEKNREVHAIFEKLKRDIVPNSNNEASDVTQKVKDATQRIAAAYGEMEAWNADAYIKAKAASLSVAEENYAAATVVLRVPDQPMLTLRGELESQQRHHLRSDYNTMVGGQIWEPASHDHTENVVQSYYVKDPAYEVRWQVALSAPMPKGLMSDTFAAPVLHAVAAAQPHSGSIKDCAFDPKCPPYQVSFVPFQDEPEEYYER